MAKLFLTSNLNKKWPPWLIVMRRTCLSFYFTLGCAGIPRQISILMQIISILESKQVGAIISLLPVNKNYTHYTYEYFSYITNYDVFIEETIVTNPTQPQLNTKMTLILHHHPPPTQTQCQHYLSCYWPDGPSLTDANRHNDIWHGNTFWKFVGKVSRKTPTLPELLDLLPVFYQEFLVPPGSSWVYQ